VITPASLTITANNQSRVYGQPNPPLTVYYQGFAGSYPIFVGGAAAPNYAIRFVSGTLAIMPPTDPVVLGRIAFVTSLYRDLLLTSPGPADLFSWLQQLGAGSSASHVASAINQSPARRALLRSHPRVGISFAVALQHAVNAQKQAIPNARRAVKVGHH
jgi:MBG domain (YGX type)